MGWPKYLQIRELNNPAALNFLSQYCQDQVRFLYAVKNLLLTNFYERPFNHGIGANLRALLFEPADTITSLAIEDNIRRTLQLHEQRIKVQYVNVINNEEENSYYINVGFIIKEFDRPEEVEIVLRRIR